MTKVYIHSPSLSQFGKWNGNSLSLSTETAKLSLQSFDAQKIEFLIFASFAPEQYTKEFHLPTKILQNLGLQNAFCIRSETASSAGASAFQLGVNLILSGRYKHGMVLATEVMSQFNREENNLLLGSVLSRRQQQLRMSMAQGGAMITRRYLSMYGYQSSDLYFLSKKLHDNGLKNPIAQIKKNLSEKEYENQTMISSPLGLYDISPLSDGSAALVLSTDPSQISVKGMGHGTGKFLSSAEPSFSASVIAFQRAFAEAKIQAREINFAELHDAFTTFELIGAEDAGLIPRGKALQWVKEGLSHPEGQLPINASGGLKSRGHPIGASGLAQIVEICRFFPSRKEQRFALAHSIGGLATNNFATILERNS
ncbi:acetyl-CoA acetyltransferase [Leptospira ryugenii]|uniref:Acetyl-CoA acetyltransferase n=1 Tax=Leptospira ryugenii TaxID=1917863 RepID=A0A2P2DX08_9LEPT|nr:thiolase family protein [Leptospira ryugenii]GBF49178.1 acetyl-CoA acetyltransferase [Leptospira ryugenii]